MNERQRIARIGRIWAMLMVSIQDDPRNLWNPLSLIIIRLPDVSPLRDFRQATVSECREDAAGLSASSRSRACR